MQQSVAIADADLQGQNFTAETNAATASAPTPSPSFLYPPIQPLYGGNIVSFDSLGQAQRFVFSGQDTSLIESLMKQINDLTEINRHLQEQLDTAQEANASQSKKIAELEAEIARLQEKGLGLTEHYLVLKERLSRSLRDLYATTREKAGEITDYNEEDINAILAGLENSEDYIVDEAEAEKYFFFNIGKEEKKDGTTGANSEETTKLEGNPKKKVRKRKKKANPTAAEDPSSSDSKRTDNSRDTGKAKKFYVRRKKGDQEEAVKNVSRHVYVIYINGKRIELPDIHNTAEIESIISQEYNGRRIEVRKIQEQHIEVVHIEEFQAVHIMDISFDEYMDTTIGSEQSDGADYVESSATPAGESFDSNEQTTCPSDSEESAYTDDAADSDAGSDHSETKEVLTAESSSLSEHARMAQASDSDSPGTCGQASDLHNSEKVIQSNSENGNGDADFSESETDTSPPGQTCPAPQEGLKKKGKKVKEKKVRHHTEKHKQFFRNSLVTASIMAWVCYMKVCVFVPVYRLMSSIVRMGLDVAEGTVNNWTSLAAQTLKPLALLIERMVKLNCDVLQADESPCEVQREANRKDTAKSYCWFYTTPEWALYQACFIHYHPGRAGIFSKEDLVGFCGKLVTDAYAGYNVLKHIIHCYCMVHARRPFFIASLIACSVSRRNAAKDIVLCFDVIFAYERDLASLSADERLVERWLKVKPLVDELTALIEAYYANESMHIGQFGRALKYFVNNKKELLQFLYDGNVPASNNRSERMVKPFALIRANCLFNGSPDGADELAILMTIARTAELNGLDPYLYMEYALTEIREATTAKGAVHPAVYLKILPWETEPQTLCKARNTSKAKKAC